MTCNMRHVTHDMWHVTHEMWHVVGREHSLKILAPQLLRFVIYDFDNLEEKVKKNYNLPHLKC